MPNHIHIILIINQCNVRICDGNKNVYHIGIKIWQPNYYERIVRDEQELFRVREYIKNNPLN